VVDVPAKGFQKRRDKIGSRLRLVVRGAEIVGFVLPELPDQFGNSYAARSFCRVIRHCEATVSVSERPRRLRAMRRSRILSQIPLRTPHPLLLKPMASLKTSLAFSSSTLASRPARTSLSVSASERARLRSAGIKRRSASVGSSSKTPPP